MPLRLLLLRHFFWRGQFWPLWMLKQELFGVKWSEARLDNTQALDGLLGVLSKSLVKLFIQ